LKTKENTYKYITIQSVFIILVLIITIKSSIQLIFSFNTHKKELNQTIDFEDKCDTELGEAMFCSNPLGFQNQVLTQNKIK